MQRCRLGTDAMATLGDPGDWARAGLELEAIGYLFVWDD